VHVQQSGPFVRSRVRCLAFLTSKSISQCTLRLYYFANKFYPMYSLELTVFNFFQTGLLWSAAQFLSCSGLSQCLLSSNTCTNRHQCHCTSSLSVNRTQCSIMPISWQFYNEICRWAWSQQPHSVSMCWTESSWWQLVHSGGSVNELNIMCPIRSKIWSLLWNKERRVGQWNQKQTITVVIIVIKAIIVNTRHIIKSPNGWKQVKTWTSARLVHVTNLIIMPHAGH